MDYSSLTDAQSYQYHGQPPPDHHHHHQPSHDPAQPQSYDPAGYYPYTSSTSNAYPYAQHPYSSYYTPSDYSDPSPASAAGNAYHHQPSDSALHPPGVSAAPDTGAHRGAPYYAQDYYSHNQHQQQLESSPVPPGLNPAAAAAVAALSQIQQYAERAMAGDLERHWGPKDGGYPHHAGGLPHPYAVHHGAAHFRPPPVRRPLYRGGGRRGGGSFRGGGRNNFVSHPSRPDFSNMRGRGRTGRGGGNRRIPNSGSAAPAPATESAAGPTAEEVSQIEPPAGEVKAHQPAPSRQPPQVSWCELCMVDCNSLEILEQHLNGKRHKKSVQRLQEFENHKKMMAEMQQKPVLEQAYPQPQPQPQPQSEPQPQPLPQPQSQCEPDVKKELDSEAAEENKSSSAATDRCPLASFAEVVVKTEPEAQPQNQGGEESTEPKQEPATEVTGQAAPAPSRKPFRSRGNWEDRRPGLKHGNMRFGRGTKRMRMSREEFPPAKLKEEPKFCALCNVTCDTQAVFEIHLSGKKHTSRLRRSQGAMGPYGHPNRSLHPQPAAYVPRGHHQPVMYDHQSQELVKEEAGAVHQGAHAAAPGSQTGENLVASQGQEILLGSEIKEASLVANVQGQTASIVGENVSDAATIEANGQIAM